MYINILKKPLAILSINNGYWFGEITAVCIEIDTQIIKMMALEWGRAGRFGNIYYY
jgi:hypothetical protein